jgi:hypothetical protein
MPKLYHQTSISAATSILTSQIMIPSLKGLAGSGIYFAETPEATEKKAHHKGVILEADVNLGKQLKIDVNGDKGISLATLKLAGYDSVLIPRGPGNEHVVYESSRVTNIRIYCSSSHPGSCLNGQFTACNNQICQGGQMHKFDGNGRCSRCQLSLCQLGFQHQFNTSHYCNICHRFECEINGQHSFQGRDLCQICRKTLSQTKADRIANGFQYIRDIEIVMGCNAEEALRRVRPGYHAVMQDLCQWTRKHGQDIYLSVATTKIRDDAITDIFLQHFGDSQPGGIISSCHHSRVRQQYTRLSSDLNKDARGDFIYLCYRKGNGRPILAVEAWAQGKVGHDQTPTRLPSSWEYGCWEGTFDPADTNKGAGGAYVYIAFERE